MKLLLYCRSGFEAECAREVAEACRAPMGAFQAGSARVIFEREGEVVRGLNIRLADLVFARQLIVRCARVPVAAESDRLTPVMEAARRYGQRFSDVFVETPDTDDAKTRLGFCRRFSPLLVEALRESGLLGGGPRAARLHVCVDGDGSLLLGLGIRGNSSSSFMGIARLRMPEGAPSRSALKLVEAIETFLGEHEALERMRAGRAAVDLGAAPGGWSTALAARGLRVTAVDNGSIAPSVLATGLVEHLRADAFRYRPRFPVDWMVCDVVAQPARIAVLAARWVAQGWCRETIFNLKLPMKKRYEEVVRLRGVIGAEMARSSQRFELRLKQLYHDRQEVTGHLRRR